MSTSPGPRRGIASWLLLVLHFGCYVLLPSFAVIAAVNLARELEWSPLLAGGMRLALFFLVVPIYFIYMAILLGRFFPRSALAALPTFLPVGFSAAAVFSGPRSLDHLGLALVRLGLPLFVGFMSLLTMGVVVLIVRNARGQSDVVARVVTTSLLLLAGYGPVVYVAALHLAVGVREGRGLWFVAQFVISVALVVVFHLKPIRTLHGEGAL
jgi:hypothetical protein